MPCSIAWSHGSGAKAPRSHSPGILHTTVGTGENLGGLGGGRRWRKAGDEDGAELLQSEP